LTLREEAKHHAASGACGCPISERIALCGSADLQERALAVPFDVVYAGQNLRAFAVRFEGRAHAYLNRCTHLAMEMDYQPNRFFDITGRWLLCATHGAAYEPDTGERASGPGRGPLVKIETSEEDGVVYWHPGGQIAPLLF
jgi:nitrite reductase/ring-hydroxylating ferredoxin subunit